MSYNKVEALRAKADAEKLILSNNYIAAREKLKKAQQLFPSLDHIVPMLTVCEVLSASTNVIPGYDTDYYWVLQLMPSSTYSDITSQYQKLVSLLEPIKYKFPATELALKLLKEAYSVLSDQKKRVMYDIKRGTSWVNYECVESNLGKDSKCGKAHDNNNNNNINIEEPGCSSSDAISEGNKGQDTDVKSGSDEQEQDFYNFDSDRTPENFELRDIWAVHCNLTEPCRGRYGQICKRSGGEVEVTWLKPIPVSPGERRWFDAGLPVACGSFHIDTERSEAIAVTGIFSYKCSWYSGVTEELFEIYPKKGEVWALYVDFDLEEWSYNPGIIKGCSFQLVEMVTDYSMYSGVDCGQLVKVNGFNSVFERVTGENETNCFHIGPRDLYMLAHKVPAYRFIGGEIDGVREGMFELDLLALRNQVQEPSSQIMVKEKDPDFLDDAPNPSPQSSVLGPKWALSNFTTGQVWAAHAGKDLMPRQYVLISSFSPRGLTATVLEPEPSNDLEASWKNRGLPIACGVFRAKEVKLNLEISQFSHQVNCFKSSSDSVYRIYPAKGEVWAVYRNWRAGWSQLNYENYKCIAVEILSDFSSGEKMMVARLAEVEGCRTFFVRVQREDGFEMVRELSWKDTLCFSHRITAYRVPGISARGIPESCWHLEPDDLLPVNGR